MCVCLFMCVCVQVERQLLHVTDSATLQLDHDDMTTAMNEDPGPDLVWTGDYSPAFTSVTVVDQTHPQ